jgi:uncharacterized phage protein (TIGR02218 family)
MKVISSQLAAHLNLSSTTLATLWKIKRQDGVILGFTDHDQDIKYDAADGDGLVTYYAAIGFTPSAVETGSALGVDNLEVTAFLEVSAVTDTDLRAGLYDFCTIEIRLVNYKDLTQGDLKLRSGTVGNVKSANGMGNFEIRGLLFRCSTAIGQLFGPTCRVELGDTKCGIDLSLWRQNGTITTATDYRSFTPPASSLLMVGSATPSTPAPAGWFDAGVLTWLTGPNAGFSMEVRHWDGTSIELFENMPFLITASDTYSIEPGCDLTRLGDCKTKFNNVLNFRGEDTIPGEDQILIYPNADGSVPH